MSFLLHDAQRRNDSSEFIGFALSPILETAEAQDKRRDIQLSSVMILVLKALTAKSLSRKEIFEAIGMRNDSRAGKRNIEPLLLEGLVEMTVPDKLRSKLQKVEAY